MYEYNEYKKILHMCTHKCNTICEVHFWSAHVPLTDVSGKKTRNIIITV